MFNANSRFRVLSSALFTQITPYLNKSLFFVLPLLISSPLLGDSKVEINVITESWHPYSYKEDGVVKGSSTEIVKETLKGANYKFKIDVYPWARAYHIAKSVGNTLIYAIVKTKERENLFKWIGQVAPTDKTIFIKLKKRNDIQISNLDEAKKYSIGTNANSDKHEFLEKNGFKNLMIIPDQKIQLKLLYKERLDILIMKKINLASYLELAKLPADQLEEILTAYESRAYMAFSPQTSDDVVAKVRDKYNELYRNKFL